MRRDMDLIRSLLMQVEEGHSTSLDGCTEEEKENILYHKNLLIKANLAQGQSLCGDDEILSVHIDGLTWEGHNFLDAVRDEIVWQKTKDKLGKKVDSAPLVIIQQTAIDMSTTITTVVQGDVTTAEIGAGAKNTIVGKDNTQTAFEGNVETDSDINDRDQSEGGNSQN